MTLRSWTASYLSTMLVAAGLLSQAVARPQESPSGPPKVVLKPGVLQQRVYCVSDLVPVPALPPIRAAYVRKDQTWHAEPQPAKACEKCSPQPAEASTGVEALIGRLTRSVAPQTWESRGGQGSIDYFPLGNCLVVTQSADVQEQVAAALQSIRAQQAQAVALDVRVMTVSESTYAALALRYHLGHSAGQGQLAAGCDCVSYAELQCLMGLAQADPATNVMAAPSILTLSGQTANLRLGEEHNYVTGLRASMLENNQVVLVPECTTAPEGIELSFRPTISADQHFIRVEIDATIANQILPQVPLVPVTQSITPTTANGGAAEFVPFTQFIQRPVFNTQRVVTTAAVPSGGTIVLSGMQVCQDVRHESDLPVLGTLPYVNRLFKNVEYRHEPLPVLILVTPRLECTDAVVAPPHAVPAPVQRTRERPVNAPRVAVAAAPHGTSEEQDEPECRTGTCTKGCCTQPSGVSAICAQYERACAEGRLADATRLAVQALAIDPTCFTHRAAKATPCPACPESTK